MLYFVLVTLHGKPLWFHGIRKPTETLGRNEEGQAAVCCVECDVLCVDALVFAFTLGAHHGVHGLFQVILQLRQELIHGLGELSSSHALPAKRERP